MCRRIAGCFVLVLLLVALVAGYLLYNVTSPPREAQLPEPPGPAATPSPARRERQAAKRASKRIEREVQRAEKVPRNDHPPVELHLTQEEANALIHSQPEVDDTLRQQHISSLRVAFHPGQVVVSARVPVFGGMKARVSAALRLWAKDGRLAYRTEDVRIGDFPAPQPVRKELDRQLEGLVEHFNRELKGSVTEVRVSESELTARGSASGGQSKDAGPY